jgi:type IX secretion system substrate protein
VKHRIGLVNGFLKIADLSFFTGGRAIYLAAGMLRLEVNPSINSSERLIPEFLPEKGDLSVERDEIFVIYPNPANNYFVISGNDQWVKNISVFDMKGKLLISKSNYRVNTDIQFYENPGLYTIRLILENKKMIWLKLVIVK